MSTIINNQAVFDQYLQQQINRFNSYRINKPNFETDGFISFDKTDSLEALETKTFFDGLEQSQTSNVDDLLSKIESISNASLIETREVFDSEQVVGSIERIAEPKASVKKVVVRRRPAPKKKKSSFNEFIKALGF